MRSSGINGERELRGQLANPGSPGKMAVKTVCVCVSTQSGAHKLFRQIFDFSQFFHRNLVQFFV